MSTYTAESAVGAVAAVDDKKETLFVASQWQLMRWRFAKHKMAVFSTGVLILFYIVALFAEFVAPHDPVKFTAIHKLAPPQSIHLLDDDGNFYGRPFVYGINQERDPETLRRIYTEDKSKIYPIYFFVRGDPYKMWGLFETDIHLLNIRDDTGGFYLLGTDGLGRDLLSRIIYGARISLSIGLAGVFISFVLGVVLGGMSGYYGGLLDLIIQRIIEFLRSIPNIPLWMGLAAAVPRDWPPTRTYFMITLILALQGWTGMAREVRGRFLSLREEDFVLAAKLVGTSELRIILGHMVPSFFSHIIAALTLAVPGMILAETSLSFLGLGLRPPAISWGVLLQDAQNISAVALSPWLLIPVIPVIVTVLAFNFMGDGLRDAADPYSKV